MPDKADVLRQLRALGDLELTALEAADFMRKAGADPYGVLLKVFQSPLYQGKVSARRLRFMLGDQSVGEGPPGTQA